MGGQNQQPFSLVQSSIVMFKAVKVDIAVQVFRSQLAEIWYLQHNFGKMNKIPPGDIPPFALVQLIPPGQREIVQGDSPMSTIHQKPNPPNDFCKLTVNSSG
jgi:hypothetical protein